jgi:hypothetical protein
VTSPAQRLFWASAAGALALHAAILLGADGLQGGADLRPHLRLVDLMGDAPGIWNVYPPGYHALGALLAPVVGLAAYPRLFAFASAALLIAGFRSFQRAAGLPDAAAALFAVSPYLFTLSWCLPKVEVAGYGLAFLALGALLRGHRVGTALLLAATFGVHTAAALFCGLCGGVLALARGDRAALVALAAGTALAVPLFASHLAAGCSAAEALLFSQGDYLRTGPAARDLASTARVFTLAGPIGIAAAVLGAPTLWRRHRPVAILAAVALALYLNELWLGPFGARTTLDLMRGLTVLALPTAVAGGVFAAARPRRALPLVAACGVYAIAATLFVTPTSCFVRAMTLDGLGMVTVQRCTFRWIDPTGPRSGLQRPKLPQIAPN